MSKPNKEELHDPWAVPEDTNAKANGTTAASSTAASATAPRSIVSSPSPSSSSSSLPVMRTSPTDDGKIHFSCAVPATAGALLGSAGGALFNIFGKASAKQGAFQGAMTMTTVSTVSCLMMKSQDIGIYDPSYHRTIAYAAGGFVWPSSGQLFNAIFLRQQVLLPRIILHRSTSCAVIGGLIGGVMDYFNWLRPERPAGMADPNALDANGIKIVK